MNCADCFWIRRAFNAAAKKEMVCCNEKSENFNKLFAKDALKEAGCDCGESQIAGDYRTMTAWDFASKYYR